MTAIELRELSVEDLQAKMRDLTEESFNLRFQHSLGQLSNPIRLRHVRREAARVRTVIREHGFEEQAKGQ
jgi:large subunit ribosomal protein L29